MTELTIVTTVLMNWVVLVWRQISAQTNNSNARVRKFASHKAGIAMAQKIAMTSPMNPVHVDLLIVTITILNALTKNASTKVLFATVKMTVETALMNLPVMVVERLWQPPVLQANGSAPPWQVFALISRRFVMTNWIVLMALTKALVVTILNVTGMDAQMVAFKPHKVPFVHAQTEKSLTEQTVEFVKILMNATHLAFVPKLALTSRPAIIASAQKATSWKTSITAKLLTTLTPS